MKPRSGSMPRSSANSVASGVAPAGGRSSDPSSLSRIVASAGSTPDEQVAGLRKRLKELESEVQKSGESSQWTLQQNKETLATLKADNKTLRGEVASKGRGRSASKISTSKATEKLEREVHDLRRQYDKSMQEKKTALSKLQNLQDSVKDLNKAAGGGLAATSPKSLNASIASNASTAGGAGNSRQARQLENRLEKAVMKANEAQSIRHMYEEIIEKMKRERDTFDGQIKGLEEASKAATVEYDRIVIASRETNHSKEVAKQDLAAFEEELAKGRAVRAARLEEMRSNSALVQNTNEALLQRQYPTAIDALKSPGAALGGGADKEELPPPPKIAEEKDAVRRLCAAVGATSTIELIDRLLPQQETGNNLKSMRALANRQLKELEGDVLLARKHLEEMKGGSCLSTQAQLDAAEGDLAAATKKAEAARSSHDATMNSYITIRSGLDHLASMVASLPPPAGAAPSMLHGVGTSGGINAAGTLSLGQGSFGQGDEIVSISEALTQCEQRLLAANKFISSLPKAAQLLQDMLGNPDFSFSTTAPSS